MSLAHFQTSSTSPTCERYSEMQTYKLIVHLNLRQWIQQTSITSFSLSFVKLKSLTEKRALSHFSFLQRHHGRQVKCHSIPWGEGEPFAKQTDPSLATPFTSHTNQTITITQIDRQTASSFP